MPDYLPERRSESSPIQRAQLARQQRRSELEVVRHGLRAWVDAEKDQIDSQAANTAVTYALESEIALFDYGVARADGSETKQELLARKLALLASINDGRIMRRFGR